MLLVHHGGGVYVVVNLSTVIKVSMWKFFLLADFEVFVQQGVKMELVREKLQTAPTVTP